MERTSHRKLLLVVGVVLLLLLLVTGIWMTRRKAQLAKYTVQISVHDRVVRVVQRWSPTPDPIADSQELEVLWANHGRAFEFYPSAAQILTAEIQQEFKESKSNVLQFTDIKAAANPGGKVKNVGELATAVRQNYTPE